ncbi:MAG: hypothetical protein MJK12_10515 [Colwellia sp.]|nr:hypothetical protein [Colwellia sp.]
MNYSREQLIGQWYRLDIDEKGQQISEYAQISPDGSYEFTFSTLDTNGAVLQQSVELGDWGLVGDIHFTFTKSELIDDELYSADLANSDNYHAYRVVKLNSQIFEYQHIVTNEVFIMRRVVGNIAHC